MCDVLRQDAASAGGRASCSSPKELATIRGEPVTADHVREALLEERLGEDTRVTILGHVQRGGAPSAFDRYLGTVLGYAAVRQLLDSPNDEPQLIGIRGHRVRSSPLLECVATTRSIAGVIADRDSDRGDAAARWQLPRLAPAAADDDAGAAAPRRARPAGAATRRAPRRWAGPRDEHRRARGGAGGDGPRPHAAGRPRRLPRAGRRPRRGDDVDERQRLGVATRAPSSAPTASCPTPDDIAAHRHPAGRPRVDGLLLIGGWAGYVAAHALTHPRR